MSKKRTASAPAETVREDYDANEWGNIELPGLTDEELHSKNWNKITAEREKWANKEMRKKMVRAIQQGVKRRNQDPEYHERLHKAINRPEHKQKLSEAVKQRHQQDPTFRYKGVRAMKQSRKTKQYQEAFKQGIARRNANPNWGKLHGIANRKAVITPFGEFPSLTEFQQQHGMFFGSKMGQMPHLYYYKEKGPGPHTEEWVYVTPYGECQYQTLAYDMIRQHEPECPQLNLAHWWQALIKSRPEEFKRIRMVRREWALESEALSQKAR